MAECVAVGSSGYHSMRDLEVMDSRTPPPAPSINHITGSPVTHFEPTAREHFNMRFDI